MSHTQGDRSSTHVKHPHYDNDVPRQHDNDNRGEHESQYMPIGPVDTYVLRLQDRHRSKDVFVGIVRIFIFNLLNILGLIYIYIYILNCYAG
jgi:hypothetical protein